MKIDIFNAEEKYDILYTDPPWQQGRGGKKAARPNSTGTTVPYETMDVPGIMELHRYVTNELMNEKHNVFMWTIDKYLPQTEEIMSLLGYKLHARLIWDKGNGPAPAYTVRFAHEYLLWFYKKGNIILPDKDKRGAFSTVLRENSKRHHSQKPECAYQMLETFFPQAKKLELFARTERDGWDQWGNELQNQRRSNNMETVTTLDDKVRAFKVLLDKKDELAEQTKANNEEIKNLEQEIAQQMVDEEKPDTTVDGFKYSLQEKTRYSKISEEKLMEKGLVFFDVLREQGFGHLITERVDPRTLDSAMNNLAAENDGELPEEMAEVLSVYSELKVSKRKANTKALNRAKKAQEV